MFAWPDKEWDLSDIAPPWGDRPSIYEHIRARAPSVGVALDERDASLPDDDTVWAQSGFRWVAGALEGAFGALSGPDKAGSAAASVFGSLKRATRRATARSVGRLYDAIAAKSTIDYIDPFMELLVHDVALDRDRVCQLALWFARGAADRDVVKWAIATLGHVSQDEAELFITLGQHEEFTLYAVVAAENSVDDPEPVIWQLATQVDGWGRIHAINYLVETQNPAIKRWMLREGYQNSIMLEYTAYVCATTGGLLDALSSDEVDDEALVGAGEILDALVTGEGGPGKGISEYADGARAVEAYLRHVEGRSGTLRQFLVVGGIRRLCSDDERDWVSLRDHGWTPERRSSIQARAERFLDRGEWRQMVMTQLESPDRVAFETAAQAARMLEIDTWDHQYQRLLNGEDRWYWVMQTDDPRRIDEVIELASERIPLDEIATGPADESGFGLGFGHHSDLGFVVQDLKRFPGKGLSLVHAALRSPVIRNRNMALNALEAWGEAHWGPDTQQLLERARQTEPRDDVRVRIQKILAREVN